MGTKIVVAVISCSHWSPTILSEASFVRLGHDTHSADMEIV